MFNPSRTVIEAFVDRTLERYREAFPSHLPGQQEALEQAARTALEILLNCDCLYHDLEHTILVTDVGQTILHGRLMSQGDVDANDWLQAVIAMLFHDVGYLRGLLREDRPDGYLTDPSGHRVVPGVGATDACLMPYHVNRSCMFVRERFSGDAVIDVDTVAAHIEMTRFPVPDDRHYQRTDTFSALVRAADLIGQMGDPMYPKKLSRLYSEFVETGEAQRLGYHNTDELRDGFPEFFYEQVYPFITDGLRFLRKTQEGTQWIANLFHHVYEMQGIENPDLRGEPPAPEIPHPGISRIGARSR